MDLTKSNLQYDEDKDLTVKTLYKKIDSKWLYHEAWINHNNVIEHWGILGTIGETYEHQRNTKLSVEDNVNLVLEKPLSEGYTEIDTDDQIYLQIEYRVKGMGSDQEHNKLDSLADRIHETLSRTGLGICDGSSYGSGTMEVICFVIDFDVAKAVIAKYLEGTEFSNYHRIYAD